jgi:hypothetical protein
VYGKRDRENDREDDREDDRKVVGVVLKQYQEYHKWW